MAVPLLRPRGLATRCSGSRAEAVIDSASAKWTTAMPEPSLLRAGSMPR